MLSIQFLEAIASLSIQLLIFVAVLRTLSGRIDSSVGKERLWATGLVLICLSAVSVMALPHLRLWPAGPLDAFLVAIDTSAFDRLLKVLFAVWIVGVVAVLVRVSLSLVAASRFVSRSTLSDFNRPDLAELWEEEVRRTPVPGRHLPELRCSHRSTGPACWQFHKPVVIVHPAILEHCPLSELRLMLRHELVHLSRQHPVQLFLQRMLEIVFWFHPSAWRLSEELSKSREMACDELCVGSIAEAKTYLRSLLTLCAFRQNGMELPDELLAFRKGKDWVGERAAEISSRSWEETQEFRQGRELVAIAACLLITLCVRLPLDRNTSRRELWSPWPEWTARALHTMGIDVRDYETYRYRLHRNEHHNAVTPRQYSSRSGG